MTSPSPADRSPPPSLRDWHGWKPLAVIAALGAVLAAGILLSGRDPSEAAPSASHPPQGRPVRALPMPAIALAEAENGVPMVAHDHFDGVPVLRIRTVEEGDEMVVEAATGRLLAVRDSQGRVTLWPPMTGTPTTMTEPVTKGS